MATQHDDRYRLYRDGSDWCAVAPGHVDLMQSPAGFGDTMEAAAQDLYPHLQMQPPVMADFIVRCARCGEWSEYGCEPDGCRDFDCPTMD